ncbi:hypothetical protein GCM10027169_19690 [Gordonia jinhuaensis]|uniref:Uncharacterized protein n=1 Tax=Gordonia jinhuaensis TaxID=1517702 RepID=A0A916X102_9ACTN|nr:hypothetical protein GCM10011489_35770 [Gordonia jinhuaensis]
MTYALLCAMAIAVGVQAGPAHAQPAAAGPHTSRAIAAPGGIVATNPFVAAGGSATMHGDAGSSDVTPNAGPRLPGRSSVHVLGAACPTILAGSDHLVVALCTQLVGRAPMAVLIDPVSLAVLDTHRFAAGGLLGGVYAFLDNRNRLVLAASNTLTRLAHSHNRFTTLTRQPLGSAIAQGDSVTGLTPDWSGRVWFATSRGVVGVVNDQGSVTTAHLPAGEQVANSISASPRQISVASTHALYAFDATAERPRILWRATYDRGSARKPGQLSWGTGSTPTFFGPRTGDDYVTIVDNADRRVHLRVYDAATGATVCSAPVLTRGGPGSENSPIGVGNTVVIGGTYGYPYPAVPDGAGPAVPATAPFRGGMTRVDVVDGRCVPRWDVAVHSAAVPRYSSADHLIHTVIRSPGPVQVADGFAYAQIDPSTGAVVHTTPLAPTAAEDTLQMSGLITASTSPRGGTYIQGTTTGFESVAPR